MVTFGAIRCAIAPYAGWHVERLDLHDAAARNAFIEEAARVCHYSTLAMEYDLAWITRELTRHRDAFLKALLDERGQGGTVIQ